MSREIRRVPPNWEHPKNEDGEYIPLLDEDSTSAFNRWFCEYTKFLEGTFQKVWKKYDYNPRDEYRAFCDWHGQPPDPGHYRQVFEEAPTWYQVYETITEGTPVTPPFETQQELIDYLVEYGDFWDQRRRSEQARNDPFFISGLNCQPWSRQKAEKFVLGAGFAPSLVVEDGQVKSGVDWLAKQEKK